MSFKKNGNAIFCLNFFAECKGHELAGVETAHSFSSSRLCNIFIFLKIIRTLCAQVCFLDASIQRWASPATDLAYFLFSSVTPMLRETHLVRVSRITFREFFFFISLFARLLQEEILGCYHDEFSRCLAKLGEDPAVYPFR